MNIKLNNYLTENNKTPILIDSFSFPFNYCLLFYDYNIENIKKKIVI